MKQRLRRPLALLLTVVMLLGLLPTAAFAAEPRSSAELTTLTLTPASGESINLMTNNTPIQWSVLETWTLDLGANLVTGQESTLTVTLAPGMQFVNLDVEALKDRLGVQDAVWTSGTPDWAENYDDYEVKSGTLTVTFASGASSLENFQLSLKPDTDLFPPELSGDAGGLAIEDAISVTLDDSTPYSTDIAAVYNDGQLYSPSFGDMRQTVFNIPAGEASTIESLQGYFYAGWIYQNGQSAKRLLQKLSAEIAVPEGLTLTSTDDAWTVRPTGKTDGDGNSIWTVTANNIYSTSIVCYLDCTIPEEKAADGAVYTIKVTHITTVTEGQERSFESSIIRNAWTIYVKDPNEVSIKTEGLPASNVYNFTKNVNEDGNFSDYNSVFAAVRLTNDGVAAIEKELIYEAQFGQNAQFVTAVGIPCDWDGTDDTGLPTSINITWNDNSTTTITGADDIRAAASQFGYPGRGFMLLAKDLKGYDGTKSITAVKVELPGLPKDYVSAGAAPIQEGVTGNNAYSAAWGRVRTGVMDGTTDTNKYRLYEKSAEETDKNKQWTEVVTTVKDSGQIVNMDSGSYKATIQIDGKSAMTAAGGDVVEVTQTIMPNRYHNNPNRPAETIIVDPVVYILQPEGLTLYANQAEFTLSTGEDIKYEVREVTGEAKDVPDGWKIYEYAFTDSDGEPIVLGWYDGDWCSEDDGVRMTAKFAYGVPADATTATYDIRDYVFYKSSLNMPFTRNTSGDLYHLNGGENIGIVASSTFTVQPQPQFIITAQMQREGDGDKWYTYDPYNSEATTALLGDDDVVNVKITVTNRTGKDVDGVTVYVPVPKTDSSTSLGDYFVEDCGFDMVIASPPNLPNGWTAYYGDVTEVITEADNGANIPSGEFQFADSGNWSSGGYDNNTNLIRLDLSGTLADGKTATLTLKLKPAGDTAQAGETNLFKTWYQFNAAGVVMTDTSKTSIFGAELQNGVVSGVVFEDANRNGAQDANEPGIPGVKVTVVDSNHRDYPPTTTDQDGRYQFTSVPTDVTLTVTIHNPKDPDPNHKNGSYRFSPVGTGTEGVVSNVIAATNNKSASKSGVSLSGGTATVNAGLITPYEVSFVVTGGSANPDSVKIYGGQKLGDVLPDGGVTVRPKEGDKFLNKWTKAPGDEGAASSEVEHGSLLNESVSADTTYTAQLEAESYTVEAQYRTSSTDDTMLTYSETVKYGEKPSESFPSDDTVKATAQEGYKFIGWKLSTSEDVLLRTEILQKEVTATATYIAQYAPKSGITVTLDPNGGKFGESEEPLTLTLTYGDIVTSAAGYEQPAREDYTFLGWAAATDSEEVILNLTCPAEDATYYAVWKENTYTITFQGYNQGQSSTSIQVKAGEAIGAEKIPGAKKDNATFLGWFDGGKTYSAEELAEVVPKADATYTARFTDVYTVRFYAGTHGKIAGSASATRSVASGETLSDIPEVTASDGWYFVWWTDNSTIYTSEALKTLPITGPTDFYARYGQISGNTDITLHTPTPDKPNSTTLTVSLSNQSDLTGEITYQWQKLNGTSWENVADGTSASLILTDLTMTNDDAEYRCVVTSGSNRATIGPVTLSVQKGDQDKPKVSHTAPSTINGTGSIGTGESGKLTTAMEYNTDNGDKWKKVDELTADNGITGISEGATYYIRYAETNYLKASEAQIIAIGTFNPKQEDTPDGSFEAADMTLSGVESGQKYSINGGETWTEIAGDSVDLSNAGLKDGDTIQIYKPGNDTTTIDSDTQIITLTQAAKPSGTAADETSYQGNNGSITITNYNSGYTYQISSKNGSTWTEAIVNSSGVISNLTPGSYVIRVQGAGTMLASEPSEPLTVNAYERSSEAEITSFKVTVGDTEYNGTINQEAGTITVTLPAGTDSSVLNNLTPVIEYTGQSLTPASGTVQDFSSGGVNYTVTAEDGTEKVYTATITIAEPNTYTITVAGMEHGSITTDPFGAAAENATVTLTITPDKGYRLKENFLKVTYQDSAEQTVAVTDKKFTMPAHNVIVSAEFEAIEYSISYKLDGGTNAAVNPASYTVEDTIILSMPTKEGYIFQGWTWGSQTKPQTTVTLDAGSVTGDLTFTAHWQANTPTLPTKYTVTVKDSYANNSGAGSYAEGDTVTIQAGSRKDYTFAGWTVTPGNVELDNDSSATTTFTMPGEDVTVTATWAENQPVPADAITVTPADIIIYMGGKDGYEGTVNDKGDIVGSKSLPEPGFVFDLPDDLESALAAAGKDITDVKFQNEDGTKTWIVQLYQGLDKSAANKLYTIVPTYEDHDSVRVVFTDGDKHIVSDNFEVGRAMNKDFGMSLYTGPAGKIKAVYGGQEYPVELGEGTLTVLGTTEKVSITTVTDQAPTNGQPGATATAGTTYTINDSEVEVTDSDVSLLFDNIINNIGNDRTGKLETRASEWLTSQGTVPTAQHQFVYELKYLDLVDANNGNAWVTASQNLTIYWPLPTGADADSLKVLHFKGLHRDMTTGEIESEIANCAVESLEFQVEDGYITFKVGSGGFSPFALVWEQAIPENTFIIHATAGSGGSISPSGSVQVTAGDSQTFYITSDRGYHIADILVNGTSVGAVSSYTFQNVQENQTITAIFARDENWGGDTGNDGNDDDDDSYTLYYHSNFGRDKTFYQTDDQRIMVVRDYEDMSRLPDREDYVFLGWNTRADGSGEDYAPGDKFRVKGSADHLYAMWEQTMPDLLDTGVSRWLNTEDHGAYLSGYGGGLFGADNSMTRAEVAQMFYALLKDKNVTITKTFYDVPADAWYATAVNTLASLGMVSGGTDGNYRPNDPITRAEFCVIALAFAYEPENARCNFTDVTLSDWFYPYVAQAASYGWIGGYTDGSFGPNDSITRAQVTTIVNNMLGRSADVDYVNRHTEELNRFTDVPSTHWAYYQIMEATNAHDYDHVKGQENWTRLHR